MVVPFFYSYYRSTLIYVGEWGIHGEELAGLGSERTIRTAHFCPTHAYGVVSYFSKDGRTKSLIIPAL